MTDRNIIVLYGDKYLIASRRKGDDKSYVVLADARNEDVAKRLRDALDAINT